ncbi:T-complex protein 1 subunit beta-like [Etheostoma cragini]|uniref:T-complex protein 1 subunit beta-like n=1 Tax=Etheostoma cragini TaxID=417921 RepID=UPI00155F2417|nr:T-complex protein 1 subunit beta-like [Etheostoma cragini]
MASLSMAPVNIFRHGADEEKAETARLSSFIGAIAIGDLVKSTLGPKGMVGPPNLQTWFFFYYYTDIRSIPGDLGGLPPAGDDGLWVDLLGDQQLGLLQQQRWFKKQQRQRPPDLVVLARQSCESLDWKKGVSPAEVEGKHRLLHRLLRHHVVENGVPEDLRQGRVRHPQNAVELCPHKHGPGFINRLPELLVQDGQIPDLEQKTTPSGCSEMLMAKVVSDLANRTPGKEAVAMESFAKALMMLPTIIADNAGYDSADLVAQLRAAHMENNTTCGLNMAEGTVGNMAELGITESFQVKRQVLLSASEAAEMILRVDNIIKAAPRKRVPDHHPC